MDEDRTVRLIRRDFLTLAGALEIAGRAPGAKWRYAISKNITTMKPELLAIEMSRQPSEGFIRYSQERMELAKLHADHNVDGQPIIEGGAFRFSSENRVRFESALIALIEKHSDTFIANRQQNIDLETAMLNEKHEFTPFKVAITEDQINAIEAGVLAILEPIIDDTLPPVFK